MQDNLYQRSNDFRKQNTVTIDSEKDFYGFFQEDGGGFALAHWNGSQEVEEKLKDDLSVTIRAIPLDDDASEPGTCAFTGEPSARRVIFARSY
jgi:prolyl-tRNA synthetase